MALSVWCLPSYKYNARYTESDIMVRVSGPRTSFAKSGNITAFAPDVHDVALSLATGISDKETYNQMKEGSRIRTAIMNAERPSNVWFRVTDQTSYWYMYALMDWYRSEVSVLSTIISRSTTELFRHDLDLQPKFARKCTECGHEHQTIITKCPVCGSVHLRKPDDAQKAYFVRPNGRSFIDEANGNGQSLKDVLKSYAESQFQNNEAYMLCVTGDFVDPDNCELQRSYPLEFLAQDPKFVMGLFNDKGVFGTTYAFTRDQRDSIINLDETPEALNDCTEEGKILYPAAWKIGESYGAMGKYLLYTSDEVYHDHWFRQALTYGVPIWYDIEDDLLTYHYLEKHFHKRYKFGYVRKMVILPGFNAEDVEDITKGIQDILATNDNSIPIICTPPQIPGTAEMKAQTLELGTEDASQAMQIKNDIRDRLCAHAGMPNIFAGDVEASGGMNNESQQITIFDRYLMDKYSYIDKLCKWIMSWFPQITDWELVVNRPSKAYTDAKRRIDKIQEAQMMKSLGFDVFYENGDFRFSEEPIDQIQRKQQEAMMAASANQPQQEVMDGGMVPGDGEGPPEEGTARREDDEIDSSKDEIDLSKREAEDAYSG